MDHHEHVESGDHAAASAMPSAMTHDQHAAHDKHSGHDPDVFRRPVLGRPAADGSGRRVERRGPDVARLHRACLRRLRMDTGGPWQRRLRVRRQGLPRRRPLGVVWSPAGNDDPDQPGDRRRFRGQLGRHARRVRGGRVVGAGHPDHGHEPRPLARDALDHAGPGALNALAELLPDSAERVTDGGLETVPLGELRLGDVVLVRPGARVPADGDVSDGTADVDESMISGESRPVTKEPGDKVVAGTVAAGASLRVRVTAVGEETALSGIMRLVAEAQASQSRAQILADRAASLLFFVALAAGVMTLAVWIAIGQPEDALIRTATVLVIACPHALGLAIPLVVAISTTLGARNGLLVKDRLALERAKDLQVIIFDKTGTLTRGEPVLAAIAVAPGIDEAQMLSLAAAVEADSEHPLAQAIVRGAEQRGISPANATAFESLPGRGARATVDGRQVHVGGPRLFADLGAAIPPELETHAARWNEEGQTVLYLFDENEVIGAVAVEDEIRPESVEAVQQLHKMGLRVAMITGDAQAVADSVARRIGIDEVAAQVLPADKADAVKRFQSGGVRVAMVGDGVNDAPALAQADVGIAIGAGTDVAVESAGIVLVRSDPRDVAAAIGLSRATYRKMVQNLVWATGYNVVAIPVAAGVLAPWGFILPMSIGALVMSISTIVVAANAQLLRGLRLRPAAATA